MTVRPARDADAEAAAAIYGHYVRESVATFDLEPRTPQQWRELWATLGDAGWPALVAQRAQTIVGVAYVGAWRVRPAYAHTVESTIYLAPEATGGGLGTVLLQRLLADAAAAGAREVIAVIADTGDRASWALHSKLGFTDAGTLRAVGYKHDRWIDVTLMQRSLRRVVDPAR